MAAGTPTFSDSYQLSQSTVFQNRIQAAMVKWCVYVNTTETVTTPYHRERQQWAAQVLTSPTTYVPVYTMVVADDSTVIGNATVAATNYTPLTAANRDAQSALATDADITNAVLTAANSFFRVPMA